MIFHSILFRSAEDRAPDVSPGAPDYFADLNLDQIVDAITTGREGYDLKPFFHAPLRDIDAIAYRHEVMQALEDSRLLGIIKTFANSMQTMRRHLVQSDKLRYREQKERWFLDAVEIYCDAVNRLARDLSGEIFSSRGLAAFRDYAAGYAVSEHFTSLTGQTKDLLADVASIEYCVLVDSPHLRVHKYAGEPDYTADVEATFERFKQREVEGHTFKFSESPDMNHIEAKVLELVGLLYPGTFIALTNFYAANKEYHDPGIMAFDREIQFYVAYLEHIAACKHAGLLFCYPRVTGTSKEIYSCQGFDLALARKLLGENTVPVCNDFHIKNRERIIVVSGPNQGGKTTFARTFGQLHYLASLGCPVPGKEAQLFLFDALFTHFEREESIDTLRGKLQDDLIRVHRILERATPNSIVIMNEIFTSTTLQDAILLSKQIATQIMDLDLLCVWVTFLDELASLSPQTVSMVSTVGPGRAAERTHKVVRRPADGLSYAMSIAEKHRLTYDMIKERVSR
jgi:DNA mismatch repair ATPase MutS